jgi:hypothetical protein
MLAEPLHCTGNSRMRVVELHRNCPRDPSKCVTEVQLLISDVAPHPESVETGKNDPEKSEKSSKRMKNRLKAEKYRPRNKAN